ncbi:polysaccharide deacetylase family protein [Streptomyces sp. B6B3]|uniref:polysaccharide deacetylase family protein n=1 Tax=Streptomyces sp. B6B3 TaxID=3153570 RepID=UPI00325DC5ED
MRRLLSALGCLAALTLQPAAAAAPSDAATGDAGTTVVSLTFDDGTADQYANARPLLAEHHLPATFYLSSGRLDAAGYLTAEQVRALAGAGHEIGGHTVDHDTLTELTDEERRRQVCQDRQTWREHGFQVSSFAYPHGAEDADAQDLVADCGYDSARDVGGLVSPGTCDGCAHAETLPPRERYAVRTPDSVDAETDLATLRNYVTQAEAHGGGWVPLVFHHVCDPCETAADAELAVTPDTLDRFLGWLADRAASHGTTVATVRDALADG